MSDAISFGSLAHLLFRHILALIWQVVRVGILWSDFLDRVSKLGRIDSKHALIDLIFEHETCIFLVHKFLHAWCSESLVSEGGVLFTLLGSFKLGLLRLFGSNCRCGCIRRFFPLLQ